MLCSGKSNISADQDHSARRGSRPSPPPVVAAATTVPGAETVTSHPSGKGMLAMSLRHSPPGGCPRQDPGSGWPRSPRPLSPCSERCSRSRSPRPRSPRPRRPPRRTGPSLRSASRAGRAPASRSPSTRPRTRATNGKLIGPDYTQGDLATEASGREAVQLTATGPVRAVHADQRGQRVRRALRPPAGRVGHAVGLRQRHQAQPGALAHLGVQLHHHVGASPAARRTTSTTTPG